MWNFFQSAVYLGGSLVFFGLLLLPTVFLLVICVLYVVSDLIQRLRERGHLV